jgi:3-hydroxybutyryl-CoA dehydrogenase
LVVAINPIQRVVVIGTGMMGPGIAQGFATAGKQVTVIARAQESLDRGRSSVEAILSSLQKAEFVTQEEMSHTLRSITFSTDMEAAVAAADLVVESIVEDLSTKQALFARLDRLCPISTIITSNTSGLPITRISGEMEHPERAATTHFWMPSHLVPLVEIVMGARTSEDTAQRLREVLSDIGKRPVIVRKDIPGQLGARLLAAITREAMYLVQEGVASAEEVDTAIKTGLGLRFPVYGPLEHVDMAGVDLVHTTESYTFPALCNSTETLPILNEKLARGELGARTGKGFYDWTQRDPVAFRAQRDAFLMARLKDLYPPKKG